MNNIRRLRCFLAAAQGENFGRAADRMNIVRPAFSRNISELEAELGVKLFDRVGRGVRLSRVGVRYAEQVADVIRRLEQANEEARSFGLGGSRAIRIGLLDFTGLQERIIDVLKALRNAHPKCEITIKPMASLDQIRAIEDGAIDAGFIYNWPSSSDRIEQFNVVTDQWRLALPADHALVSADKISLKDLVHEDFVSISPDLSPFIFKQLMGSCNAQHFTPKIVQYASTTNGVTALVAAGMGVCFITGLTQPPAGVLFRPIDDLHVNVPLDFVWRRDETNPILASAVEAVVAALRRSQV